MKRRPSKPTPPIAKIIFPREGKLRKVVETFPHSQEGVEDAILAKFAGALAQFHALQLSNTVRDDPWPDYRARVNGSAVGIELTELIREDDAQMAEIQNRYARRLHDLLSAEIREMDGWLVSIDDGYQNPLYPTLQSKEGEALSQFLAERLRAAFQSAHGAPVGRMFALQWDDAPRGHRVGVFGMRLSPSHSGKPLILRFSATFPHLFDEQDRLLANGISKKLQLHYGSFDAGDLWLLAYELASSTVPPPPCRPLDLATDVLARGSRFDKVWYFYPYAGELSGAVYQVWPAPQSTTTTDSRGA